MTNKRRELQIGKVFFVLLRFSGHFSFSLDKELNGFKKNQFLKLLAIFQSLLCMYFGCKSSISLLILTSDSDKLSVRFDMLLSVFGVFVSCAIIIYEKTFRYDRLLEIFNESREILYGPFYDPNINHKVRKEVSRIIILFYIIIPNTYCLINGYNFLMKIPIREIQISALILLVVSVWIFATVLPFTLLSLTTRHSLLALKIHMKDIWMRMHNGLNNSEIMEVSHKLNEIAIHYSKTSTACHKISQHYSMHLLINLLLAFFYFSYTAFLIVISIGRCLQANAKLEWTQTSISTLNLLFYLIFIWIIVMFGDQIICQYDEIIYHLHKIQKDELCPLLEQSVNNCCILIITFNN